MGIKKVLLIATIGYFFPQFEMNDISLLKEMGYEVHCAADFTVPISEKRKAEIRQSGIITHQIDFTRKPLKVIQNYRSYCQLNELIKKENFEFIHCHTPVAGAIARLSAHHCGLDKVIYTAHGFHFYKGGPLKNWLIFYTAEKFLSRYTKVQITINHEDYEIAKRKFHAKSVRYVPGVGIELYEGNAENEEYKDDEEKLFSLDKKHNITEIKEKREMLGVTDKEYMVVSVGELINRKNHLMIINAIAECKELPLQYFILGRGTNEEIYRETVKKLDLNKKVHLLGYRDDVKEIDRAADLFVFPSFQEGLPLALMEAIRENTPVIASDIRGNRELVPDKERLFNPSDPRDFIDCLKKALKQLDEDGMQRDVIDNVENLRKFSVEAVTEKMREIYESIEE